jgi:hypothetical protein
LHPSALLDLIHLEELAGLIGLALSGAGKAEPAGPSRTQGCDRVALRHFIDTAKILAATRSEETTTP